MHKTTPMHKTKLWTTLWNGLWLAAMAACAGVHAQQTTFQQLQNMELARVEDGARAQAQIDRLDDQRMELVSEYRVVLKQRRDLEKYNDQLRTIIASQEEEKTSLRDQINRVGTLERDIMPMMADMLDTLDSFVELDLPFFLDERRQRIKNLRTLLGQSDVSIAEKYRRILEAYQIENDYGRSLEAAQKELPGSTTSQRVNFLKVGRLALFYQTLDGEQSYRWDTQQKQWQHLDDRYNKAIKQGILMAKEQIAVELLVLPLRLPQTF